MMGRFEIDNTFSFHPATPDTAPKHEEVRSIVRKAALDLDLILPESREKSICITKLQEAMMFANAAIAKHG